MLCMPGEGENSMPSEEERKLHLENRFFTFFFIFLHAAIFVMQQFYFLLKEYF